MQPRGGASSAAPAKKIRPGAGDGGKMKIVILAPEDDNHTAPIKWSLEKAGYKVVCWSGLGWNETEQASIYLGEETKLVLGPHSVEPGDVVWIRRPEPPVSNPKVTDADKKFADLEYRTFYHNIAYLLEKLPVWVINDYSSSRFTINKSVQLLIARKCGMKVPRTLMSNCPGAVKDFLDHNKNRTICKAFMPHVWQKQDTPDSGVAVTETFELKREHLPSDEVLTYAPGIYQDMVVKEFDIRMVLMGSQVYSYALHNPKKALDWRQDAGQQKIQVESVATPPEIETAVLAFAKECGICFGSLDFAVDMQGQWWFLEINEQGQFLWLDQFTPAIKINQKFCAFITAPEGSTEPLEKREDLFPTLAEYEALLKDQVLPPVDSKTRAGLAFVSNEP
jgi:glutathione synthase/RimK-type ligase-like ATP-grasp enzyme